MSKVLVIIWKWTKRDKSKWLNNLDESKNSFEVKVNNNGDKIIGFTNQSTEKYTYEQIYNIIVDNQGNELYFLFHKNENEEGKKVILELKKKLYKSQYSDFGDGKENALYEVLIDGNGYFTTDAEEKIEDVFNKVWEHYCKSCKKKLYELREELLLNLYPIIFPLENGNSKLSLPDLLVEKINCFIDKKELFADCDYRENAESIFLDLKEKLGMLLSKPADELLQFVAAKDSANSKENKYLVIPEYFRTQFDKLLISYNKDEPIY